MGRNDLIKSARKHIAEALELIDIAETMPVDSKIKALETELRDCRNELCLKCGQYQTKHLGSCNGCRWE